MTFDLSEALARVGGDEELLKEIAGLFLDDAPGMLDAIRVAVRDGDATALHRFAHSLKGSVANFGANETVAAAFKLEKMGASGKLEGAQLVLEQLEIEMQRVFTGLSQLA